MDKEFKYGEVPPANSIISPVDTEVQKEKVGYSVITDKTITCSNCNKKLLSVVKILEDPNVKHEIKVFCPYCEDESFIYTTDGKLAIGPLDHTVIADMQCQANDNKTLFKHYIIVERL